MRGAVAFLAGGLFGLGLFLSGMTDTVRAQGWLDMFGRWDPTLGFVLGGAILPMAVAWRLAARQGRSLLGAALPGPPTGTIDRDLLIGSLLFGIGWALAGLCPGPALASLSFGGWNGLLFLIAMLAAMVGAPALRRAAGPLTRPVRHRMDIRHLTDSYAVSPQIAPEDVARIKEAGFVRVICNRPDGEIPAALHAAEVKKAVLAAGMEFVDLPILPGQFPPALIAGQKAAMQADGPVFAYCATGNRCSIIWALTQAGERPADELIGTAAEWGYNLEHLRPLLG